MVRQRPGSAKGVMFITLEDETDIANLIIWPSLFDRQRRVILGAQMLACRGKVQAANGVIHVVAEHLMDQSDLLRRVGGSDEAFVIPTGRGDEAVHGGGAGVDSRDAKALKHAARDIFHPGPSHRHPQGEGPEFSMMRRKISAEDRFARFLSSRDTRVL